MAEHTKEYNLNFRISAFFILLIYKILCLCVYFTPQVRLHSFPSYSKVDLYAFFKVDSNERWQWLGIGSGTVAINN
jgi:hypothetical protein